MEPLLEDLVDSSRPGNRRSLVDLVDGEVEMSRLLTQKTIGTAGSLSKV